MKGLTHVLLTLSAISTVLPAQSNRGSSWAPPIGSRVRLTSPVVDGTQTGTLISADDDSVVIRLARFSNPLMVRTSSVTRMEVVRGTHTRRAKGALLGFLIAGGLTAAQVAATWDKEHTGFIDFGRWGDAALVGGVIGVVGAGVGFVAGTIATDSWQKVPVPKT